MWNNEVSNRCKADPQGRVGPDTTKLKHLEIGKQRSIENITEGPC